MTTNAPRKRPTKEEIRRMTPPPPPPPPPPRPSPSQHLPQFPISRKIIDTLLVEFCEKCGSSIVRRFRFFDEKSCIQPECEDYKNYKKSIKVNKNTLEWIVTNLKDIDEDIIPYVKFNNDNNYDRYKVKMNEILRTLNNIIK